MRFRSALIPTLLVLGSSVACDCDSPATNTNQASFVPGVPEADSLETESPAQTELEGIRWRCQSFLTEHNPEITVQGFTFNQLTPNVYLINVDVTDNKNNKYVKQLSCEKARDIAENDDGDLISQDEKLYIIDYADPFKMAQIAERHGFANEVRDIHSHNALLSTNYNAGYTSNWMDDYLLWSVLYNRPHPMYYGYGAGFAPRPVGYRPYAPASPINSSFVKGSAFGWIAGRSAGRSYAFTSGIAKAPPTVNRVTGGGTAFSTSGARASVSSVGRGGFGSTAGGHGSAGG